MLDVARLATGTPVNLNVTVGPHTRTVRATFIGSTSSCFTVEVDGEWVRPIHTYRWADPAVWIADPLTGTAYTPNIDDPVLESTVADRE